jgi:hypothetical protein
MGYQSPQIVRLTGARFGYRFFPSIKDSKWGFYVSADLRMQRLKDYWNANSFNEKSQDYQEHTIKTVELLAENYIGYGLKYSINQSFSLSQGVGLGWYISGLKTKSDHTLNNMVDLVDYRGYDDLGFVWNIRFEINYWF